MSEMNTATCIQILDEAVFISHRANPYWNSINLTILFPATGNSKKYQVLIPLYGNHLKEENL